MVLSDLSRYHNLCAVVFNCVQKGHVCLDERLLKMILIEIDLIKIEFEVK